MKKLLTFLVAVLMASSYCWGDNLDQPATTEIDGEEYYLISSKEDLLWFFQLPSNYYVSQNAILTCDIVVNEGTITKESSVDNWNPISNFSGVFDGNGYTISGIYLNELNAVNPTAFIRNNHGTIKNLGIINSYFGGGQNSASICSLCYGGYVYNCYSNAIVEGPNPSGICGYAEDATIQYCYNAGTIIGTSVSGICCEGYPVEILNCFNIGKLEGKEVNPISIFSYCNPYWGVLSDCAYLDDGSVTQNLEEYNITSFKEQEFLSGEIFSKLEFPALGLKKFYKGEIYTYVVEENEYVGQFEAKDAYINLDFNYDNNQFAFVITDSIIQSTGQNIIMYDTLTDNAHCSRLKIIDSLPYDLPPISVLYDTIIFERFLTSDVATFAFPFEVSKSDINGTVYKLDEFDGETVRFKKVEEETLDRDFPYVLLGKKGDRLVNDLYNVNVSIENASGSIMSNDPSFSHAYSYSTVLVDSELLSGQKYGILNGQLTQMDSILVKPFRTIFIYNPSVNKPSPRPVMAVSFDGELTGVMMVENNELTSSLVNVYDINGRVVRENVDSFSCLENLAAGIYIVNGEKFIVKEK